MDKEKRKKINQTPSKQNFYQVRVTSPSVNFECPICKNKSLLIKGEVVICDVCAYVPEQ